jgi:hypothetical protein
MSRIRAVSEIVDPKDKISIVLPNLVKENVGIVTKLLVEFCCD